MTTLITATTVPAARIIPTNDHHDALKDALRDAARWLQSAGDTCNLQSLKDAAARAEATLAAVQS
jgi:antitoxin (DNA-binding transcriptional repressor) of toxin-antitoxin stability system